MKLIGIVGRAYYNKDNQTIMQVTEDLRKAISITKDITPILLLPTNKDNYLNLNMGEDKIENTDQEKLDYILDKCDGFIIPGGTSWYLFDEYVINYAIKTKKPLLAICAGFQCLCSMYAINRNKFDMTKRLIDNKHYGESYHYQHQNKIIENTLLSSILDKQEIINVNSIHHDYIDFPMKELKISALSLDNIIEAVELPTHPFLIGLQWHPEYLMDDNSLKILNAFFKAIKESQ